MASEKQIAANRLNAKKSTGPRTPEGKAATGQNAFVHGLRCRQILIPGEDPAQYEGLAADLNAEWQPTSPTEAALVEQIAVSLWKIQRLDGLEQSRYDEFSFNETRLMESIWRQQARLERSFHKAIDQLKSLRKDRATAVQPQPAQTPELACASTPLISTIPDPPALVMQAVTRIPHQVSSPAPCYVTEAELNQQSQFDGTMPAHWTGQEALRSSL